jgi:hypothetical protein
VQIHLFRSNIPLCLLPIHISIQAACGQQLHVVAYGVDFAIVQYYDAVGYWGGA